MHLVRGRPNKPVEQHEMEGTKRSDRHPGTALVLGDRNLPVRALPDGFTQSQMTIWDAVLADVSPIVSTTDLTMLENFVVIVDRLQEARWLIKENGLLIEEDVYNKDGDVTGSKTVPN